MDAVKPSSTATLAVPAYLIDRLQSILHAAARLVNGSCKYDHVSSLLRDLHWLQVPERIMYRLAVLVFLCRNHTAPEYLTMDLHWVADNSRRRLRSATTHQLMVPRMRLRTVGVARRSCVWNCRRSCVERSTMSTPQYIKRILIAACCRGSVYFGCP